MGALDLLNHIANLFVPALMLGGVAAGLAKLAWRHELAGVPWRRLAGWAAAAAAIATVAGLAAFGRDGRMATYGAMVGAAALALWWLGFVRRG